MADKTITYRVIIPGFEYDSFGPIVIDEIRISELNGDWLYTTHDKTNSVSKAKDMHFIRFDSNYYPYAAAYTHTVGASQAKPGALGPQYSAVLTDTINYAGGIYKEASAENFEKPEDGINGTFYDFVLDEEVVQGGKHHILSIYPNYKKAIKEQKERPRYTEDNNNDEHAGLCYLETLDFYHKFYIKYEAFTNINGKLLKVYEDTVIYSPSGAITAGDITLGSESLAQQYFDQEYIDGDRDSWEISDGGSKMDAYRPLLIDPSGKLLYYQPSGHKYSVCTDSNGHELYANSDDLCMHIYPQWQKEDFSERKGDKDQKCRFTYQGENLDLGVCISPFKRSTYHQGTNTPQVPNLGGWIPPERSMLTPSDKVGCVNDILDNSIKNQMWQKQKDFFAIRQSDNLSRFSQWEYGMLNPKNSYYSEVVAGQKGQTYNQHGLYRVSTKFFGGEGALSDANFGSSVGPIHGSWWEGGDFYDSDTHQGEKGLFEAITNKNSTKETHLWEDWCWKNQEYGRNWESHAREYAHFEHAWEANGTADWVNKQSFPRWPRASKGNTDNSQYSYGDQRLTHFSNRYPNSEYAGFMHYIAQRVSSLEAEEIGREAGTYNLQATYSNILWYGNPVKYLYYSDAAIKVKNISPVSGRFIAGIYWHDDDVRRRSVWRKKDHLKITYSEFLGCNDYATIKEGTIHPEADAGFYSLGHFSEKSLMLTSGESREVKILESGHYKIQTKVDISMKLFGSHRDSGANHHNQFLYFANNAQLCVELDPVTTQYSGTSDYRVFKQLFLHKQILDTSLGSEQIELQGFQYNPDGNSEILPTNLITSGDRGIPEAVVEVFGEQKFLADVEKQNFHSSIEAPQVGGKLISERFSLEGGTIYIFHINYLPKTYIDKLTGKDIKEGITVTISNTQGSSASDTLTEGQRYLAIKCPGRTMSNLTMTITQEGSENSLVNRILNAGIYTLKPLEDEMEALDYDNLVSALDSEASKKSSDIVMITQNEDETDVITPWVILPAVFCFSEFGQSCDDKEYNYIGFPEQPYQECVGWYEVDMSQTYGTQKNLYPYAKLTDLERLKNINLTSYMTAYGEEWWNNTVITNQLKIRTV